MQVFFSKFTQTINVNMTR